MNASIKFLLNKASAELIAEHLLHCDCDFIPPLSGRVQIQDYAQKISVNATRFEAWSGGILIGLVAAYCNDQVKRTVYITSVSILKSWTGKGVASHLMRWCAEHGKALGMRRIALEVGSDNTEAIRLYQKSGFIADQTKWSFVTMNLDLENWE